MPKLFRIGAYYVFFWSNENDEPIHVHVSKTPSANATKIWLTKSGGCILASNKEQISNKELNEILNIISSQYFKICSEWKMHFKTEVRFYC